MTLSDIPPGVHATVLQVLELQQPDPIAARLRDLGFVTGEPVQLVAHGPFGADPILVQVGSARFALRRSEAARILIETSRN